MRRAAATGIAVLGVCLWAAPSPVRAGVYISAETRLNDFRLGPIKLLRGTLQSLALPARPNDSERAKYERLLKDLEAKDAAHTLTDIDRADLGGLYIRFRRPRDAARVLSSGQSNQFLVLCNLAVAEHDLAMQDQDVNRLEEAILTQRHALAAWPDVWTGWSDEQWYFYRRVEKLQLRLLELRFREMRIADGKPVVWQSVDDLFPGFRMTGPGGEYEAGRVAPAAFDALPPDAPWLVRELLMAYPTDPRLYWLFGEILNSCGRVEDAREVLDDLVNVNQLSNIRELVAHRRVLLERATLVRDLRTTPMFQLDAQRNAVPPSVQENLLWALAPRGGPAVPVGGVLASEAAWWATADALEVLQREERLCRPNTAGDLVAPAPAPPPIAVAPPASPLPEWRTLAVGFAAGVVVAVVFGLQRTEWKRRRQATVARKQAVP